MRNLAERLREVRDNAGLSQHALADRCGIALRSQQNYEKGDRSPDANYLAALAAQGMDVLYILTGQRSQPVPESAALAPRERALLDNYRRCSAAARQHLAQAAVLLANGGDAVALTGAPPASVKVSSKHGHAAGRDVNVNT